MDGGIPCIAIWSRLTSDLSRILFMEGKVRERINCAFYTAKAARLEAEA
jgi:hypothetical protein